MDYGKYYRINSDGTYTLHFPNSKAFTIDQIREIFSSYGNVLSVNISGDIYGLRYVRYKTLDEIKRCLNVLLQDNSNIRILPQKDKINNANKKTDPKHINTHWQKSRMENSFSKSSYNDKQFNTNSTCDDKFMTTAEKSAYDKKNSTEDNRSDQTDIFSDSVSSSSRYSYKHMNKNWHDNKPSNKFRSNENDSQSSKQQNFKKKSADFNHVMKLQEIAFQPQTKFNENTCKDKDNFQNNKMPALVSNTRRKDYEGDCDSQSSHPLTAESKNTLPKLMIIRMQDVIVANIHSDFGVHYILHLFEKHDPISATVVQTISDTDIRYCHVYFKTVHDAVAVEEEFDNFVLAGRNLIVLRKLQLIDAAACK